MNATQTEPSPTETPTRRRPTAPYLVVGALLVVGAVVGLRHDLYPLPQLEVELAVDVTRPGAQEVSFVAPEAGTWELVLECEKGAVPFDRINHLLLGEPQRAGSGGARLQATGSLYSGERLLQQGAARGGVWTKRAVGAQVLRFESAPGQAFRLVVDVARPAPDLAPAKPTVRCHPYVEKDVLVQDALDHLGEVAALKLGSLIAGFVGVALLLGGVVRRVQQRRAPAASSDALPA